MATKSSCDRGNETTGIDSLYKQKCCSISVVEIKGTETNPLIARGAFGRVDIALLVRMQHPSDTEHTHSRIHSVSLGAIKTIPNARMPSGWSSQQTSDSKLTRDAFAELNTLRLLNGHENVIPLLGYYGASESSGGDGLNAWVWDDDAQNTSIASLCLVFPYHPIDLHDALIYRRFHSSLKHGGSYFLSKKVVQSVFYDILSALLHLHYHCILHRDVKPGNLYITREGRIQLGDFGLAKIVPPKSIKMDTNYDKQNEPSINIENVNITNGLCTLQYRPPEVLLGSNGIIYQPKNEEDGINGAFDMFSAGCIFAELLTLSGPIFPGQSVLDQLGRIFQVLGTPSKENWPDVKLLPDWNKIVFEVTNGEELQDRIGRPELLDEVDALSTLLVLDPLKRYSARECLEHKMFRSFDSTSYRNEVCNGLLPPHMQIMDPVYFSPNNNKQQTYPEKDLFAFAEQYATIKAATRRNFVNDLNKRNETFCKEKKRWSFDNVGGSC